MAFRGNFVEGRLEGRLWIIIDEGAAIVEVKKCTARTATKSVLRINFPKKDHFASHFSFGTRTSLAHF